MIKRFLRYFGYYHRDNLFGYPGTVTILVSAWEPNGEFHLFGRGMEYDKAEHGHIENVKSWIQFILDGGASKHSRGIFGGLEDILTGKGVRDDEDY